MSYQNGVGLKAQSEFFSVPGDSKTLIHFSTGQMGFTLPMLDDRRGIPFPDFHTVFTVFILDSLFAVISFTLFITNQAYKA